MQDNALILRATVMEICGWRQKALDLYAQAHSELNTADATIKAALMALTNASGSTVNRYNYHSRTEDTAFLGRLAIPKLEDYQKTVERMVDRQVWARVIELSNIEALMDKKAKDEFTKELMENPPPATEDNIRATVQSLMGQRDLIFKRGVAECFSNLDRRFKSHDGWKIGSRVVLTYAFDSFGSWCYHRNERDTMMDIERVFFILEGLQPPPGYGGIVAAVEESRRHRGYGPIQSFAESEYFRVRGFKNGNAHVWFKRDDLVEKVNKLLGEYYDAPIPEEREADKDDGLHNVKTSLAKNYGFYPTPDAAADFVFRDLPFYRSKDDAPYTGLEPHAGTGQLSRRMVEKGVIVDCVEYQPALTDGLRQSGLYRKVINADFLAVKPDPDRLYDFVVANPPFDRERDIDHVLHSLNFLKPNGMLVAIMSAGTEFRETKKSIAFRELISKMGGKFDDLPARSFSSVGTNVNTIRLRVRKNGSSSTSRFW